MTSPTFRVLAVHGIGNHQDSVDWQGDWNATLRGSFSAVGARLANDSAEFVMHDSIFERYPVTPEAAWSAFRRLAWSGVTSPFRRQRFFGQVNHFLQWYAGMVVQWVDNERLRAETRDLLLAEIERYQPDIICGHSLGSLICYDTLTQPAGRRLLEDRTFVSLGSQINNAFVSGQFLAGKVLPLEHGFWYHLYNRHDRVFTAPISMSAPNFRQVDTEFREKSHGAVGYLGNSNTIMSVWNELAFAARMQTATQPRVREFVAARREPQRRALLVGINDYPQPDARLEGCVNDVFEVSSVLQECGFDADDIRVVLDDRATKRGIMERLDWLLADAGPGDQLVLSFSGHGAQLPVYDSSGRVEHKMECLAPHDFDWSEERSITDEDFFELYSQLPYETSFVVLLDCCHSGGMARSGGRVIRGLTPPDDIRHRMLRWDRDHQMWVPRDFRPLHEEMAQNHEYGPDFVGYTGDTMRLGAAMPLRTLTNARFDQVTRERGHEGPYMPLILHACHEDEFAYEYRHGVTSYGAFTYVLAKVLREFQRVRGTSILFEELVDHAAEELDRLGYEQSPDIVGPEPVRRSPIPWGRPPQPARQRTRKSPRKRK